MSTKKQKQLFRCYRIITSLNAKLFFKEHNLSYDLITLFSLNDNEISLGMLLNMVESICSMRLYDIFKLLIVVESSDKAEVGTLLNSLWDRSTDSSIVDYKMSFQTIRNLKDVNNFKL